MKPKTWKLTKSKTRDGWFTLIGPYDPDFIEAFKEDYIDQALVRVRRHLEERE